jgi:hypothetical protein
VNGGGSMVLNRNGHHGRGPRSAKNRRRHDNPYVRRRRCENFATADRRKWASNSLRPQFSDGRGQMSRDLPPRSLSSA